MSVYKITSESSHQIYVGSTTYPLHIRFKCHRNQFKDFNSRHSNKWCSSFNMFIHPDCKIELIERVQDLETLRNREQHYLDINRGITVNKHRAVGLTAREYYDRNKAYRIAYQCARYNEKKEELIRYQREWNDRNKDKCKAAMKRYREKNSKMCETCNRKYYFIERHYKSNKHKNNIANNINA